MWKRYVQPIRSENFWRSTNSERVILPSSQAKLRKNALFIDQSVFSNFALYVIIVLIIIYKKIIIISSQSCPSPLTCCEPFPYIKFSFFFFQVFDGNKNSDTVVYNDLTPIITARFIRFLPWQWNNRIAMRIEIFGCPGIVIGFGFFHRFQGP